MLNFTVGPVQIQDEIRELASQQIPYFRTSEFSSLMKENETLILKFFHAPQNANAVFLTGSGTAAMEAAVINSFDEKDRVLVVNGGSFGARFAEICKIYGIPCEEIKLDYGESLQRKHLEKYEQAGYTGFLVNLHETSTGTLYDMNLLSMMKDFDEILKKNNIEYSLCGGSLLGAVRHDGFIPWDDDVDIMMDRKNYDRLIKWIPSFEHPQYAISRVLWIYRFRNKSDPAIEENGNFIPTIDIFVMDTCPENVILRKTKVLLIKILQGMMHQEIDYRQYSLFYRLCLTVTHGFGKTMRDDKKARLYDSVSRLWNKENPRYIGGYNDLFRLLSLQYEGNILNKIVQHPFEDTNFPIIAEYDSYLTTQYGDYMTPPDEKDRVPLHS